MALKMMDTAQPNYLERLRIVWVVFLRFTAAFSYRAWLAFQQSSSLVYVCIRPRIGPLFLFFSERIPGWPCFSHVGRMAGFAVTLPFPILWFTALGAQGRPIWISMFHKKQCSMKTGLVQA